MSAPASGSTETLEARIVALLEERGPQTGAELRAVLGDQQSLEQWQVCHTSPALATERVGRRYLRLDEKVAGYSRLSPSILREFLTYSVVGLTADSPALAERTRQLAARIQEISAAKLRAAERVIAEAVSRAQAGEEQEADLFTVLIAGDIAYEMAHDAPRPEKSTGQMVRGSDLDLVVILADQAPSDLEHRLDDAIYQQKYRYLINPSIREEIDYTVKRIAKVREQVEFGTFREMVSCKIMDEAVRLSGSARIFVRMKELLAERGIPERLQAMEEDAHRQRETLEARILHVGDGELSAADRHLFMGTEERDEFD